MKKLIALGAMFWVAGLAACGAASRVGQPCTVQTDCEPGQSCFTSGPGGFCSKGCSFQGATTAECPGGTVCTHVDANTLVCAPICQSSADCREQYGCGQVIGSTHSACQPL
jgi:hypothetical protein